MNGSGMAVSSESNISEHENIRLEIFNSLPWGLGGSKVLVCSTNLRKKKIQKIFIRKIYEERVDLQRTIVELLISFPQIAFRILNRFWSFHAYSLQVAVNNLKKNHNAYYLNWSLGRQVVIYIGIIKNRGEPLGEVSMLLPSPLEKQTPWQLK